MELTEATGVVVTAARGFVHLFTAKKELLEGKLATRSLEVTVGDSVRFARKGGEIIVEEVYPRKNCLIRADARRVKHVAANLDRLIIVSAMDPLFNSEFVDRVLTSANVQGIECMLVVNKLDLGLEETAELIDTYRKLGLEVSCLSAKCDTNFEQLTTILADPSLNIVALCGISGVGKSTILNKLVPDALQKTSGVSEKTGQGRQTTSQAYAYPYSTGRDFPVLIIDLPGAFKFGVAHLTHQELCSSMVEIAEHGKNCQYDDCSHTEEPDCVVLKALETGDISESRYKSYLAMREEISQAKAY